MTATTKIFFLEESSKEMGGGARGEPTGVLGLGGRGDLYSSQGEVILPTAYDHSRGPNLLLPLSRTGWQLGGSTPRE